jgi:hypothetical protein
MSHHHGPIRVVLATDSFLLGDGLACLLADVDDVEVVGRARDHEELAATVEELQPDAVIISIRTPVVTTMTTIEAARKPCELSRAGHRGDLRPREWLRTRAAPRWGVPDCLPAR